MKVVVNIVQSINSVLLLMFLGVSGRDHLSRRSEWEQRQDRDPAWPADKVPDGKDTGPRWFIIIFQHLRPDHFPWILKIWENWKQNFSRFYQISRKFETSGKSKIFYLKILDTMYWQRHIANHVSLPQNLIFAVREGLFSKILPGLKCWVNLITFYRENWKRIPVGNLVPWLTFLFDTIIHSMWVFTLLFNRKRAHDTTSGGTQSPVAKHRREGSPVGSITSSSSRALAIERQREQDFKEWEKQREIQLKKQVTYSLHIGACTHSQKIMWKSNFAECPSILNTFHL
jgi:hypothetical protein